MPLYGIASMCIAANSNVMSLVRHTGIEYRIAILSIHNNTCYLCTGCKCHREQSHQYNKSLYHITSLISVITLSGIDSS